jgi:biopolymer transport protein ExbB
MFVVSMWVVVAKLGYVNRNERENHAFLDAFHAGHGDVLAVQAQFAESSLSQVHRAGAEEIRGRINGAQSATLTPKAVESIRATIDAARVREGQKLNRFMVLLTIAISGGPFLGLLGTVVGVMITFAAIAATGDVNVAAIAPGIAAALVATVAGLAVAIPALFAYNYIGTRIKNISADMQVFADEFLARIAEKYEA